jgi:hypothetical protein
MAALLGDPKALVDPLRREGRELFRGCLFV